MKKSGRKNIDAKLARLIRYVKDGDRYKGGFKPYGHYRLYEFMVEYFGFEFIELWHSTKAQREARQIYFLILHIYFGWSAAKIAREHCISTLYKNFKKWMKQVEYNENLSKRMELILYKCFYEPSENSKV